jgi:hypothetical protein
VGAILGFVTISVVGAGRRLPTSNSEDEARPAVAARAAAPAPVGARRARLHDLERIESNLTNRIAELEAADAVARFLPPRDMPARFGGPAVGAAVETAIAASGVGGRVDEIDCSAFPCLVVAHYARGDLLGRLQRELNHNPQYSGDVALVMPVGDDPAGRGGQLVGAIIFPRAEPRAAEILAAFKRRRAEALAKRMGDQG